LNFIRTKAFYFVYGTTVALLAVLVLLVLHGMYRPILLWQEERAALEERRDHRQRIQKLLADQQNWIAIESSLGGKAADDRQSLIDFNRNQQYLRLINDSAAKLKLTVNAVQVSQTQEQVEISFEMTGSYLNMTQMIYQLETSQHPLKLHKLELDTVREALQAKLTLLTWRPTDEKL
jgi:hypothetical protein